MYGLPDSDEENRDPQRQLAMPPAKRRAVDDFARWERPPVELDVLDRPPLVMQVVPVGHPLWFVVWHSPCTSREPDMRPCLLYCRLLWLRLCSVPVLEKSFCV